MRWTMLDATTYSDDWTTETPTVREGHVTDAALLEAHDARQLVTDVVLDVPGALLTVVDDAETGYEVEIVAQCDCCDADALFWVDGMTTRVCLDCYADGVRAHLTDPVFADGSGAAFVLLDLVAQLVEQERVS